MHDIRRRIVVKKRAVSIIRRNRRWTPQRLTQAWARLRLRTSILSQHLERSLVMASRRPLLIAVVLLAFLASYPTAAPNYSDWGAPVNLGPVVNSPFNDVATT
jgi:hypothetical protein